MSLVSFIGPRPNLFDLKGASERKRLEVRQPILTNEDLEKIRMIGDFADNHFQTQTLDITYAIGARRRGHGHGVDAALRPRRARRARRLQHHHPLRPAARRRARRHSGAARHRRRPQSPDPQGAADLGRPRRGDRRGARGASFLRARRLRRRGDQSLSRLRDAARHARRRRVPGGRGGGRGRLPLHQVDRQRRAEGHVQDGHLDLPVLLRRADLRRDRPLVRLRAPLLLRHLDHHRGRRPRRDRRGDDAPPSGGLQRGSGAAPRARCRRRIRLPPARRGPHVDAGGRWRCSSTPCAARASRPIGNMPTC